MLAGTRIVLGVTGGVAAYKAAYLARRLIESGASVRAVMTASAREFLGAQTLGAITGSAPLLDLFGGDDVSPHTSLARWADAVVIAPATAASIGRLANGLSEDPLSATVLARNVFGANDQLNHASIGVGGMGFNDLKNFIQHKRTQVVAICETDPVRRGGDWTSIQGNFGPLGEVVEHFLVYGIECFDIEFLSGQSGLIGHNNNSIIALCQTHYQYNH